MPTGKIKYYNEDKGYGFIAQDEGEDLFFHILKSPSVGEIKAGQRVKYEITRGKKGLEAEDIQLILTPFEQRKLSQGRVVVSKGTLVWTPTTDVPSKTRQPEQRPSVQRERPVTRPTPSKPSPKPSVPKEVKKSSPGREKAPAPKKAQKLPKKESEPPKKPTVKVSPAEEKKPPEEIKREVKPQEPVSQKTQEVSPPEKISEKKPQRKRILTYGDRYMLKQIRENTPMVFEMYNHESISCTVAKLFKYDLELLVDGGEKMRIQKHNIKYCYKQENAEKVKAGISFDESIRSQGLMPIVPRKERYQIDYNMVKETWGKRRKVRLVTREGEIIMGPLNWFSSYEVKVNLPPGGNVVAFFHALSDFKILSDEEVSNLKEQEPESTSTILEKQEAEEVSTPIPTSTEEIPLGEKIRIARKDLGMSQKDLAESFGVSTQTIGNWERGKSQPQTKYQEQIEQFFATAQSGGS